MNNISSDALENEARKRVDELKGKFVIDGVTAERLQDIFLYLILSKANRNPRGVEMQQNALKRVLHTLPATNDAAPAFAVQQLR